MWLRVSLFRLFWVGAGTELILDAAIPKEHTIFRFTVPLPTVAAEAAEGEKKDRAEVAKPLVFELHGSQFENRPVDRANKKFKWRNVDYL